MIEVKRNVNFKNNETVREKKQELVFQSFGLNFIDDYLQLLRHYPSIREDSKVFELYNKLCDRVSELLATKTGYKLGDITVVGVIEIDD